MLDGVTIFIPGVTSARIAAQALAKALAVFLASAAAREATRRVRDFLQPEIKERVTDEELMREVEKWMREQAEHSRSQGKSGRRPRKGLALPLLPSPTDKGKPGVRPVRDPAPGPRGQPGEEVPPGIHRRERDASDPESFVEWFERRFVRSGVRFQRLRR